MLQIGIAHGKKAYSISKQIYKFTQELNMHQNGENDTNISTKQARDIKKTVKAQGLKQIKQNWENKPLHGKYPLQIKNDYDPKCRFCNKFEKTVDHLVPGCQIMTPN